VTTCQKRARKPTYPFENAAAYVGPRIAEKLLMDMSSRFRRLLCLGTLFVGAAAGAQTLTLSFPSGEEMEVVGRSACTTQFSIGWTLGAGVQPCKELQIWASTKACSKEGPTGDDVLLGQGDVSLSSRSGTFSNTPQLGSWPRFKGAEADCGTEGEEGVILSHNVCGLVFIRNTTDNKCDSDVLSKTLVVVYKTKPPPAPTVEGEREKDILQVKGYDGRATIRFSASGDYLKEVLLSGKRKEAPEDEEGKEKARAAASAGALSVSGLEDNTPYTFTLKSIDKAGNESPDSEAFEVTTTPTQGFWDIYKQAGGTGGGCHAAGRGGWAALVLGLLSFYWVRRPC